MVGLYTRYSYDTFDFLFRSSIPSPTTVSLHSKGLRKGCLDKSLKLTGTSGTLGIPEVKQGAQACGIPSTQTLNPKP